MSSLAEADRRDRHLLVVDDDDGIRRLLREYLTREGFRVTAAADAAAARRLISTLDFDLLVVDVMMPGEDGLSLTRWVRETRGAPVLMLTARDMASDRIEGLRAGVDDYLGKPFEPEELVLRIDAVLRRARAPAPGAVVALGACRFDPVRGELMREGRPVRLTEGEVALLRRLARTPHVPVDRADLDGGDDAGLGRAVDVQVTRLRKKIEADPRAPRFIQTVRGRGYLLAPE